MTTTREAPDFADLDDEREVDLRKYWNALLSRWWLPALGLVAGLIVGYIFTLGGNQVYEATATLYLGQPYSGTSSLQGLATNPTYVSQVIKSEAEARRAARASGLKPGQVKNNLSTQTDRRRQGRAQGGTDAARVDHAHRQLAEEGRRRDHGARAGHHRPALGLRRPEDRVVQGA